MYICIDLKIKSFMVSFLLMYNKCFIRPSTRIFMYNIQHIIKDKVDYFINCE